MPMTPESVQAREGAQIAYLCAGQAEGPWMAGDLLYVCLTRESGAITLVGRSGPPRYMGAHMLPTMFRDWQAGRLTIIWRSAEWVEGAGRKWDAAPASLRPPAPQRRATA